MAITWSEVRFVGRPAPEDIAVFLESFSRLNEFECNHYFTRKWGAFNRETEQLPNPSVVRVLGWLESQL
jgi:hypothetical protein